MAISSIQAESAFVVRTVEDKNISVQDGVYNYFASATANVTDEDGNVYDLEVKETLTPIVIESPLVSISNVGTSLASDSFIQRTFNHDGAIYDITYGDSNGYMAITDSTNSIWSSPSGVEWTENASSTISGSYRIGTDSKCAYANNKYFALVQDAIYHGNDQSLSSSIALTASVKPELVFTGRTVDLNGGNNSLAISPEAGDLIIVQLMADGSVTFDSPGYTLIASSESFDTFGAGEECVVYYKYADGTETSVLADTGSAEYYIDVAIVRNGFISEVHVDSDTNSRETIPIPDYNENIWSSLYLGFCGFLDTSSTTASYSSGFVEEQFYYNGTPDMGSFIISKEFTNNLLTSGDAVTFSNLGNSVDESFFTSIIIRPTQSPSKINDVIHDGSQYVFVGNNGFIGTSSDLSSITEETSPFGNANVNGIVFDGTNYIAVGGVSVFYSSDLSSWTESSVTTYSDITNIEYDGTIYILQSANGIWRSLNGTSWTKQVSYLSTPQILGYDVIEAVTTSGNHEFALGTPPATLYAGDLIFVYVSGSDDDARYLPQGDGTNGFILYEQSVTSNYNGFVFYKKITSTTTSSQTFSFVAELTTGNYDAVAVYLRGVDIDNAQLSFTNPVSVSDRLSNISGIAMAFKDVLDTSPTDTWTAMNDGVIQASGQYKVFQQFGSSVDLSGFFITGGAADLRTISIFLPATAHFNELKDTRRLVSGGGFFFSNTETSTAGPTANNSFLYSSDGSSWSSKTGFASTGMAAVGQKVTLSTDSADIFQVGREYQAFVFRDRLVEVEL